MASRDEMIRELKRRDMIKQLKERDIAAGEAEATRLADQKYEETKPSALETVALNAYQGATRNWGDELAGKIGGLIGKDEETISRNMRDRVKRTEVDRPVLAAGSKIGGEIATTPLTLNPAGAAAIAGASGTARSLGAAEQVSGESLKDAAVAGGIDATTAGLLTRYSPRLLEKAAEKGEAGWAWLKNTLQSKANQQAVKALGGTKGQMQALQSSGKIDDVGQMLLEKRVVTPFASSGKIAERVAQRGEDLAAETAPIYDAAASSKLSSDELSNIFKGRMDELSLDPGSLPVADQLSKYKGQVSRVDEATRSGQVKDLVAKGADITDAEMFAPGKSYSPADLRKFRQGVAKGVNFNTDAVGQQGAKQAGGLIREQEMKLIENVSPDLRAQNEALFKQLHLNSLAEDMAESGAARSGVNNTIGLNTWQAGNVAAELTNSPVKTVLIAGAREVVRRLGPQTSAVTLNKIAQAMETGQFAPMFAKAAERGPQAVAALHQALLSRPEYKALVGDE